MVNAAAFRGTKVPRSGLRQPSSRTEATGRLDFYGMGLSCVEWRCVVDRVAAAGYTKDPTHIDRF